VPRPLAGASNAREKQTRPLTSSAPAVTAAVRWSSVSTAARFGGAVGGDRADVDGHARERAARQRGGRERQGKLPKSEEALYDRGPLLLSPDAHLPVPLRANELTLTKERARCSLRVSGPLGLSLRLTQAAWQGGFSYSGGPDRL